MKAKLERKNYELTFGMGPMYQLLCSNVFLSSYQASVGSEGI